MNEGLHFILMKQKVISPELRTARTCVVVCVVNSSIPQSHVQLTTNDLCEPTCWLMIGIQRRVITSHMFVLSYLSRTHSMLTDIYTGKR